MSSYPALCSTQLSIMYQEAIMIVIKEASSWIKKIKIFSNNQLIIKLTDVAGVCGWEEFKFQQDQNVLSTVGRRPGKHTWISGEGITDEPSKQNKYPWPQTTISFVPQYYTGVVHHHFPTLVLSNSNGLYSEFFESRTTSSTSSKSLPL